MAIINQLGLTKSAGVGVAEKVCGFIMLVPSAYMQALSAYVAQNVGAGKPERAKKALYYSIGTSVLAGTVMFYIAFFQGELLASIFSSDREVIRQNDLRHAAGDFLSFLYQDSGGLDCQQDGRSQFIPYRAWDTSLYCCADCAVSDIHVLSG